MIHDVSLRLGPGLPVWPSDPAIEVNQIRSDSGFRVSHLSFGSHAGTHVDAPAHLMPDGLTVDALNPTALIGQAAVIHIPDRRLITPEDLGVLGRDAPPRVLIRTANSDQRIWQEPTFRRDYSALCLEAAQLLVAQGTMLLGIDGPSVEPFGQDMGPVHRALLQAGVVLLEGLMLADVAAGAYDLICAPLAIEGGDGAPARVFLVE